MAIVGTEINYYQSATVNDTSSNGGRISSILITSGLSNSWWPNVTEAQLVTGATQWRKGFFRIDNANNETAYNFRVGIWKPTPGGDILYLASGTQTDIQSGIGNPDLYGVGTLDTSVLSGAEEIDVLVEDGGVIIFRDGDIIRISDQTTVGGSGNAEYVTIQGTPVVAGDVVTITLATGLLYDYSNTNTYVCSLIDTATVAGDTSGKVIVSSSGTFDEGDMVISSIGSMYQTVTFTFSSATAFNVTSDLVTFSPASGTIDSTYAPTNVGAGAAYFSVPTTCWGGTWTSGDTLTIVTIPPCVPIWEKRVIPVGASAISSQTRTLMAFLES